MSNKCQAWAWERSAGDATAKAILVKMADLADDDWFCFPSHRHLADQCEADKRTITRKITQLEERGLLASTPRYRDNGSETSNGYWLNPTPEQIALSKKAQSERRSPKIKALQAAIAAKASGTETLPPVGTESLEGGGTETLPQGRAVTTPVTQNPYPSDTESLGGSDSEDTPITITSFTPHSNPQLTTKREARKNHHVSARERMGELPAQCIAAFESIAAGYMQFGEVPRPGALALFHKHVWTEDRVTEFCTGLQNTLQRKAATRQPSYMNLDRYILTGGWQGATTPLAGPVTVPGAAKPSGADAIPTAAAMAANEVSPGFEALLESFGVK